MKEGRRETKMKVTFYGTRGSIPVPDPDFVQVGGNTSCILFTSENGRIAIFDAGTGIRTKEKQNGKNNRRRGLHDDPSQFVTDRISPPLPHMSAIRSVDEKQGDENNCPKYKPANEQSVESC